MDRKYTQRQMDEKKEDINQKFYGTDLKYSFAESNDWSNKYTFLVQKNNTIIEFKYLDRCCQRQFLLGLPNCSVLVLENAKQTVQSSPSTVLG